LPYDMKYSSVIEIV